MLRAIENRLGLSLHRFIRPHQLPIGVAIVTLVPALELMRLF